MPSERNQKGDPKPRRRPRGSSGATGMKPVDRLKLDITPSTEWDLAFATRGNFFHQNLRPLESHPEMVPKLLDVCRLIFRCRDCLRLPAPAFSAGPAKRFNSKTGVLPNRSHFNIKIIQGKRCGLFPQDETSRNGKQLRP